MYSIQQKKMNKPQKGYNKFFIFQLLLHEKFLQFDWLRSVVFQLNLKYLRVKITNLLWVVVNK